MGCSRLQWLRIPVRSRPCDSRMDVRPAFSLAYNEGARTIRNHGKEGISPWTM